MEQRNTFGDYLSKVTESAGQIASLFKRPERPERPVNPNADSKQLVPWIIGGGLLLVVLVVVLSVTGRR